MSVFNTEDLKSEINTIINVSKEPMETSKLSSPSGSPRKSILKTPNTSLREAEVEFLNHTHPDFVPRPHTLNEFVKKETLTENSDLKSTFTLDELDEDDEIWVMDIPGTIDPLHLKGQLLQLGDQSKFKIGEDRYYAINRDSKSSLTCVFNTDKESGEYKAVNIKPAGTISIRRKLSGVSKKKLKFEKSEGVPFPKNIKLRHPFFGTKVDKSAVKEEKEC